MTFLHVKAACLTATYVCHTSASAFNSVCLTISLSVLERHIMLCRLWVIKSFGNCVMSSMMTWAWWQAMSPSDQTPLVSSWLQKFSEACFTGDTYYHMKGLVLTAVHVHNFSPMCGCPCLEALVLSMLFTPMYMYVGLHMWHVLLNFFQ